jgi:ABC-type multidrug transport system ATPase subunit
MSSAGIVQSVREDEPIGVSLRDVSISTRRGGFVVEGISGDIPGGSFAVLTGSAGTGHSALLLAMTGRFKIASGRIEVGGHSLPEDQRWVRRHTAIQLSEADGGFDGGLRVREEVQRAVLLGRPGYQQARGKQMAQRLDEILTPWCADIDPQTLLGELTAWQRARLKIALGVVPAARVVAIDGIGNGIPEAQKHQLWQWLAQWAQNAGVTVLGTGIEVPGELPANTVIVELDRHAEQQAS